MGSISRLLGIGAAGLAVVACGGGGNDAETTQADGASPQRARALAIAAPSQSVWSARFTLPLVPTTAANLPDGKVLLWSAEERF